MSTINGRACVANGTPVDKVFSDGRQVYGRNYILNTADDSPEMPTLGGSHNISGTYTRTSNYVQIVAPASGEFYYRFNAPVTDNMQGLVAGETYVISGEAGVSAGALEFRAQYHNGTVWHDFKNSIVILMNGVGSGGPLQKFQTTFTIPPNAVGIYISLQCLDYTGNLTWMRFRRIKLEQGSVATPRTPAPEDVM